MSDRKLPRPAVPYPAPPGQVWVASVADDAVPSEGNGPHRDRKCSHGGMYQNNGVPISAFMAPAIGRSGSMCNAQAVMKIGNAYRCANHAEGRWVEWGVVMVWTLEDIDTSEEK
jgi:hypothetical protein